MDRYFTSIPLAHWFSEKGFKVVGKQAKIRKEYQKK